jgi:hypothetical protein
MPQQAKRVFPAILCCRAAAKAEGELIRHKAAEEAAELAAKEAAWRAKAKEMNAATKASNDTLLAFRAAERQRDKQLEAAFEGKPSFIGCFGTLCSFKPVTTNQDSGDLHVCMRDLTTGGLTLSV